MTTTKKQSSEKSKSKLIGLDTEREMLSSIIRRRAHALLVGEKATGKTSLVQEVAESLNRTYRRVNCNGFMTPDQFIGRPQFDGKRTYFEEGLLPRAMRAGEVLIIDEINSAPADTLFCLHAVLEKLSANPTLKIPELEEPITPAVGFCVIATMNPTHEYAGTKALNEALLSRFDVVVKFSGLEGERLIEALKIHVPKADSASVLLVSKIAENARRLKDGGKINSVVSLREMIATLELIEDGISPAHAVRYAILSKLEGYEIDALEAVGALNGGEGTLSDPEERACKGRSLSQLVELVGKYQEVSDELILVKSKLEKLQSLEQALKGLGTIKPSEAPSPEAIE